MLLKAHEPRWLDYVFGRHGHGVLANWVRRLRYFRFNKAQGGHANDGDQLLLALRYTDEADLHSLLQQLGLRATTAVPEALPAGWVELAGNQVRAYVRRVPERRLEISLSAVDNPYEVTAQTVAITEALEAQLELAAHESRIIDPLNESIHCVCPQYYPELWVEPALKGSTKRRKLPAVPPAAD
ncbi:hypothetical protein A0257_13865 [Hymenobacter psoromatis]|nr:hypothetical protein A0257_13865 [Hymenobacter psoromatis]